MNIEAILLKLKSLSSEELDSILDKRDEETFDSAWCQSNEIVSSKENNPKQEEIFKKLSNATNSHEISSYIIDDINLIYKAKASNIENKFISYLAKCYKEGEVPYTWHS